MGVWWQLLHGQGGQQTHLREWAGIGDAPGPLGTVRAMPLAAGEVRTGRWNCTYNKPIYIGPLLLPYSRYQAVLFIPEETGPSLREESGRPRRLHCKRTCINSATFY